jgi:hypothetical protein
MEKDKVETLLNEFKTQTGSDSFVKMTLSKPISKADLISISIRPTVIKGKGLCEWLYHYNTRDIVKNKSYNESQEELKLQTTQFRNIDMFTANENIHCKSSKKGKATIMRRPPTHLPPEQQTQNKQINTLIKPHDKFLNHVGITTKDGVVRADMKDKYNQLVKFIEILDILYKKSELNKNSDVSILDCGSGKSYLTFALHHYFFQVLNKTGKSMGIELRKELSEASNIISLQNNYQDLAFTTGNISEVPVQTYDLVTALHACDTATDDTIAKGVLSKASLLIVSPCCHKYVRKHMNVPDGDRPVLRYGIHAERFAEMLTDSLRALTLQYYGYETNIIEFVPSRHTPKNVLITAVKNRKKKNDEALEKIQMLKAKYGLNDYYLDKQLGIDYNTN